MDSIKKLYTVHYKWFFSHGQKRKQVHQIFTRVQITGSGLPKRKERRDASYCQKIWVKMRQPGSNLDKKN